MDVQGAVKDVKEVVQVVVLLVAMDVLPVVVVAAHRVLITVHRGVQVVALVDARMDVMGVLVVAVAAVIVPQHFMVMEQKQIMPHTPIIHLIFPDIKLMHI